MNENNDNHKWSVIRGCSFPAILLLLVLAILLTGCGSFDGQILLAEFNKDTPPPEADLLTLVNPWNSMDEDYVPSLAALNEGTEVDERCLEALLSLLEDCRAAGHEPYICSAYRTWDTQTKLYENKVARVMASGADEALAREIAATEVALPGTSEHQLGLAVDIIDSHYTVLDEGQAFTGTQLWLMDNSWRYGFILRYPEGKSDITGIIYEPWHYRYVGEAAADIYESGLCLEEWLNKK